MAKAILTDIEGTTTPIDFVHKTLFPFARDRMAVYVRDNFSSLTAEIAQLSAEIDDDGGFDPNDPSSVSDHLCRLIDLDRKSTPLKSIQGNIWETGYTSGELLSEIYDDVPAAFERWHASGKTIAIYSSGSVLAQQLLFRHTRFGDLTGYINGYFDTKTGAKRETASYQRIADLLRYEPADIVFLSDIPAELDAAAAAGVSTILTIRPGNAEVGEDVSHVRVNDFTGLE